VVSELGGAQMSTLLESLPGIANVLRSPVADALVNTIRAAAGLEEWAVEDVEEIVRYATRRGLLGADEGERVLAEVYAIKKPRKSAKKSGAKKPSSAKKKSAAKKKTAKAAPQKKAAKKSQPRAKKAAPTRKK